MTRPNPWQSSAPSRRDRTALVASYYAKPIIRARMRESLGKQRGNEISAVYIAANADSEGHRTAALDPSELDRCLDEGKEIYRSLWDRKYLVANLDIEYVNLDHLAQPYERFEESYGLQKPVVQKVEAFLRRCRILPQHVLSGRGHHLTWNIRRDSPAFLELAQLGKVPASALAKYGQPCPPHGEIIGPALARAFAGLGLVLEYVAHEVVKVAAGGLPVPLTLTAVETLSRRGTRECVSLDISEYGDPLHTRSVRLPYSVYYKPQQQEDRLGQEVVRELPLFFMLPVGHLSERLAWKRMHDAGDAEKVAGRVTARIPDQSTGTARLTRRYRGSRLARFHDWFYSEEHESPAQWPQSYDATSFDVLPASVRKILAEPNDLLLKPGCLRHVVRVFLALGWHPRHIAGLVRSKFERDYGWGEEWFHYDASLRADFYCRVFAGLIVRGLDDLSDFRCPPVAALHEQATRGREDLEPFKKSLNRRMRYDRLASRPFHRLFL